MDSTPILAGLGKVTSKWTHQRKAEERSVRASTRRRSMWIYQRVSLKDICHEVMADAWAQASDGGRLPTHWRMVFYRARPLVAGHPDADRPLTDAYFKQVLDEYLEHRRPGWDILRGARGVFKEPHERPELALSTMGVRQYLKQVVDPGIRHLPATFPTVGSTNRFGAVLICEKEGFDELLRADGLPARYDLALMSTKGISAHAARDLISAIGARCFTLHDFDKNGFVMASGFRWTATDIGLRLDDIEEWGLADEEQPHRNPRQTHRNLRANGATEDEAAFIASGRRVELNELTGPRFIEFVERKLQQHGVTKVVPDEPTLAAAWRRALLVRRVNALIDEFETDTVGDDRPVPDDLVAQVRARLKQAPVEPWDKAVFDLTAVGS